MVISPAAVKITPPPFCAAKAPVVIDVPAFRSILPRPSRPAVTAPVVIAPLLSTSTARSAMTVPRSASPPLSTSILPPLAKASFEVMEVVVILPVVVRSTSPSVEVKPAASIEPASISRLPFVAPISSPDTRPVASMSITSALTLPVKLTAEGPATPPMVRSPKVLIVLVVNVPLVSRSIFPSEDTAPRSRVPPPVLSTSIKPLITPGSFEAIEVVVISPAAVKITPPPFCAAKAPVIIDAASILRSPSVVVTSRALKALGVVNAKLPAVILPLNVVDVGTLVLPISSAPPASTVPRISVPVVSSAASPSEVKTPRSRVPPPVLSTSTAPPIPKASFAVIEVVVMSLTAISTTSPSVEVTPPAVISSALILRSPSVDSISSPETTPVASISITSALTLLRKLTPDGPFVPPIVKSPKLLIIAVVSAPVVSRSIFPSEDTAPRSRVPPPVLSTSIKPLITPGSFEAIEVVVMLPAAVSKTPPPLSASRAPVVIDVPASRSILPFKAFTAAVVIAPIASISTVAPVRDAVAV